MTGDKESNRDSMELAIFEASRARLFSLAYRILGVRAEAEDVVQETFVKWHLHNVAGRDASDAIDTPAAWLVTVARRTAIDRVRHRRYETPLTGEPEAFDLVDPAPSAESLAERTSELADGVRRLLDRLSSEECAAFLLREAFEADYASIAKILNRSAANCRQIVHRAKDRVRGERTREGAPPARHGNALVAPLLDAIARQDVGALVALTLTVSPASVTVASAGSYADAAAAVEAARLTRALIARLRLGRIDAWSADAERMAAFQYCL